MKRIIVAVFLVAVMAGCGAQGQPSSSGLTEEDKEILAQIEQEKQEKYDAMVDSGLNDDSSDWDASELDREMQAAEKLYAEQLESMEE